MSTLTLFFSLATILVVALGAQYAALKHYMDAKFQGVDDHFRALENRTDDRFKAVDDRFEALENRIDDRFDEVNRRFDHVDSDLKEFDKINRTYGERIARLES